MLALILYPFFKIGLFIFFLLGYNYFKFFISVRILWYIFFYVVKNFSLLLIGFQVENSV